MPHTAEYRDDEESVRLRPYQNPSTGRESQSGSYPSTHPKNPYHSQHLSHQLSHHPPDDDADFFPISLSREQRLASVHLHCCYQILWFFLVLLITLIPIYNWLTIVVAECLSERENQIIASVFIALFSGFIAIVLAILNCCSRKSISCYRVRFCTFCFVMFTIVSAMNFLIGIYFFAIPSCYFFVNAVVEAFQAQENALQQVFYRYDLKISGILHLICSIIAFAIGIGFAIIKNNFKYVRQIDFE